MANIITNQRYNRDVKTVCPSGLRGWTQVPLAQAAWVQIPQLSNHCTCGCQRNLEARTRPGLFLAHLRTRARAFSRAPTIGLRIRAWPAWPRTTQSSCVQLPLLVLKHMPCQDSLPEWSKGVDSSSTSASCVGSNPTAVKSLHLQLQA